MVMEKRNSSIMEQMLTYSRGPLTTLLISLLALCAGCPGEVEKKFQDSSTMAGDVGSSGTDGTYSAGGPCPCKAGQACIATTCRKKCIEKPCNAVNVCTADESCLKQGSNKTSVCMPGAARGMPCDTIMPCKGGLICLSTSTSGGIGRCYHTCTTAGTSCATGGKCYNTPAGTCRYCYP